LVSAGYAIISAKRFPRIGISIFVFILERQKKVYHDNPVNPACPARPVKFFAENKQSGFNRGSSGRWFRVYKKIGVSNFNCFFATGHVIQKAELYKLSKVFLSLTGLTRFSG